VTAFRQQMAERHGTDLADYSDLYEWSVAHPAEFWRGVWDFCGVVAEGSPETVLVDAERMPGARWFPDTRLNYAENLLTARALDIAEDETEALVFRGESGGTRRLSWGELRRGAAAVAAALRADGIGPGDRVAVLLDVFHRATLVECSEKSVVGLMARVG
jgi:acetoacetyl-CoA synthetase